VIGSLPVRHYRAACGVVVSPAGGQVLVLLRPDRLGPQGVPELRLPKGHIEPGESPKEAALREVAEEAGVSELEIIADLGHQTVEFEWRQVHIIRQETYFLMACSSTHLPGGSEEQFRPLWLTWEDALRRITYEAEREWLRRARQTCMNSAGL
jgi:ADP-ribose pyrophosphatase YjhB (NUDIX family)